MFEPGARVMRTPGAISKSEAYEAPASEPTLPGEHTGRHAGGPKGNHSTDAKTGIENSQGNDLRQPTIAIAQAAKSLNGLRENWLNPPEWTHKVPEVTPAGMAKSHYPDMPDDDRLKRLLALNLARAGV